MVPFEIETPKGIISKGSSQLKLCEQFIRDTECYLWLSERFEQFQDSEYVRQERQNVIDHINETFTRGYHQGAPELEEVVEEVEEIKEVPWEWENEKNGVPEPRIDLSMSLAKLALERKNTK